MERILKEETVYTIYMARFVPLAKVQLTDARQIIQVYSEVQINITHGEYFAHMVNILCK
jgi:hypothetical protein